MLFEAFVSEIASVRESQGSHTLPPQRCAALHEALGVTQLLGSCSAEVLCVRFKLFLNDRQAPPPSQHSRRTG